jgi:hypothetical protein
MRQSQIGKGKVRLYSTGVDNTIHNINGERKYRDLNK